MTTCTQNTKTTYRIEYPGFIENPAFDYRAALIRNWLDKSDDSDQQLFRHFLTQYLSDKAKFTASLDCLVTPKVWERVEGMHVEPLKTRMDVLRSIYLCTMQKPCDGQAVVPRTGFAVANALDHWGSGYERCPHKSWFAAGLELGLVSLLDLIKSPEATDDFPRFGGGLTAADPIGQGPSLPGLRSDEGCRLRFQRHPGPLPQQHRP
ncbi:hypothetical protein SynWH8103_01808 [Synechococcus sp. WH 8103]|nr:hypothetical protein SynWH8103_01808 [Synechococcus sp. WH 8103]